MESAARASGTARQVRTRRAMLAGVVGGLGVSGRVRRAAGHAR